MGSGRAGRRLLNSAAIRRARGAFGPSSPSRPGGPPCRTTRAPAGRPCARSRRSGRRRPGWSGPAWIRWSRPAAGGICSPERPPADGGHRPPGPDRKQGAEERSAGGHRDPASDPRVSRSPPGFPPGGRDECPAGLMPDPAGSSIRAPARRRTCRGASGRGPAPSSAAPAPAGGGPAATVEHRPFSMGARPQAAVAYFRPGPEPEPQRLVRARSKRGSRRSQWRCSPEALKASVSDMVKPWIVPG